MMDNFYFNVLFIIGQTCAFDVYDFNMVHTIQSGRNFSFLNCDRPDTSLHITGLNVTPHPVTLDHWLKLNISLNLTKDVGKGPAGIEVDMILEMKTPTQYISLCDIVGKRFCYLNLCEHLEKLKDHCPPELAKLTDKCRCPMKAGVYKDILVPVRLQPLPFYLRATFDITIQFKEEGKHIGCVKVHLCVNECMFV